MLGICVPTYGRIAGAQRVIESIRTHVRGVEYRLLVGMDAYEKTAHHDRRLVEWLTSQEIEHYYADPRIGSIPNQNRLWHQLYESGCDPIIMLEDDVELIAPGVAQELIHAATAAKLELLSLRCPYDVVMGPYYPDQRPDVAYDLANVNGVPFSFSKNVAHTWDWFHMRTEVVYLTRQCIEAIGYMDPALGPYHGPGHPDYVLRARRADLYPKDWFLSPLAIIPKLRWDLCGRSNCTDEEVSLSGTRVPLIYGKRPLYIPYGGA